MRRDLTTCAVALLVAIPTFAQTNTVVGGVVADSSIVAPVITLSHTGRYGGMTTFGVNGWSIFAEITRPRAPRQRLVASIEFTPWSAHSSNRMYAAGQRTRDREFRDSAIEVTWGRLDSFGERWSSDLRAVALYERVTAAEPVTRDFWSSPYAGVRSRMSYRHITADDPLLLTFEGSEAVATAEVFGGREVWSRARVDERMSRRIGPLLAGETASLFSGRSIDTVNAFLAGGSWPVAGLLPLYGYRYGELRLDRGAAMTATVQYTIERLAIAAHGSALHADGHAARGVALDVSGSWRGIGLRGGVAWPREHGRLENRPVVYGSVLGSSFVH